MAVKRPGVGTVPDCGSSDPLSPPAAAARADEVSRATTGQSQQSHVAHRRKLKKSLSVRELMCKKQALLIIILMMLLIKSVINRLV